MKHIFIFLIGFVFFTSAFAQQIGSKVSLTAVDGKNYTGVITDIQGGKYKVKYDGVDFDAWLTSNQFTVTDTLQTAPPAKNERNTVDVAQNYRVGDKVEAFDNGKWYNATILEKKGEGYIVHWDGFSSTYDAIVTAAKVRKKTGSASNEAEDSAPKMKGNLPDLPGTKWALKSMTKRGAAIKEYGVLPTMDFCKSGKWTLGRYRGTNEGGKYQITGSRIIFRYEDGSVWGDYKMNWNESTGILELTNGTYTIRMIYKVKLNNC